MSRSSRKMSVGSALQFGRHNMSHKHLTSLDFGRIQPITVIDCVPNDEIHLSLAELVITTAPNPAPIQGKIKCHVAAFYVPNRVVFPEFNNIISGMSSVEIPQFDIDSLTAEIDHLTGAEFTDAFAFLSAMGLPLGRNYRVPTNSGFRSIKGSVLPLRCYNRIWWDWYRNSNVIPDSQKDSYLFTQSYYEGNAYYIKPKYACWQKDFLTNNLASPVGDHRTYASNSSFASNLDSRGVSIQPNNTSVGVTTSPNTAATNNQGVLLPFAGSNLTTSINSLRNANALQTFLEKCNVLGGRLIDRLRGMFGSTVQPETLQMSEFLGMNTFDINFTTSASSSGNRSVSSLQANAFGTAQPDDGQIKGQLSGDSTMTINGLPNINYHVKEHGYFFILAWVMPDVLVADGLDPLWIRGVDGVSPSRFDFLTPELVNTSPEPFLMFEACLPSKEYTTADVGSYTPFAAIGYRGRYSSYTYKKDNISGCFADPNTAFSMRNWVLNRDLQREGGLTDGFNPIDGKTGTDFMNAINFDTLPFITAHTRQAYDDKFTMSSSMLDHFVCQANINLEMIRPLPDTCVPRIESVVAPPTSVGGSRL